MGASMGSRHAGGALAHGSGWDKDVQGNLRVPRAAQPSPQSTRSTGAAHHEACCLLRRSQVGPVRPALRRGVFWPCPRFGDTCVSGKEQKRWRIRAGCIKSQCAFATYAICDARERPHVASSAARIAHLATLVRLPVGVRVPRKATWPTGVRTAHHRRVLPVPGHAGHRGVFFSLVRLAPIHPHPRPRRPIPTM
eukprot:350428-Chlamydomonas_euryale.AAC.5